MAFQARVLADSFNLAFGKLSRLTTVELTYPRIIHSEFLTHRMFSRNSASSRAIPVEKMLERVRNEPFIPIHWGAAQKGMQAYEQVSREDRVACETQWLAARDEAVWRTERLLELGLHKQIPNRLVEPWMWITVIATGTRIAFENFFKLRCHHAAEPHIQKIAYMLRDAYDASEPAGVAIGECHLPLTGFEGDETLSQADLKRVATARCARVSYLTHDGKRDVAADIELHERLAGDGHWSPFEHVATACVAVSGPFYGGNLGGSPWQQYRKEFAGEVCTLAPRE